MLPLAAGIHNVGDEDVHVNTCPKVRYMAARYMGVRHGTVPLVLTHRRLGGNRRVSEVDSE